MYAYEFISLGMSVLPYQIENILGLARYPIQDYTITAQPTEGNYLVQGSVEMDFHTLMNAAIELGLQMKIYPVSPTAA